MRLLEIKRGVDEVQELDQIVDNGGSLYTILARIHEWADEGENRWLARVCRATHSAHFEQQVLAKISRPVHARR